MAPEHRRPSLIFAGREQRRLRDSRHQPRPASSAAALAQPASPLPFLVLLLIILRRRGVLPRQEPRPVVVLDDRVHVAEPVDHDARAEGSSANVREPQPLDLTQQLETALNVPVLGAGDVLGREAVRLQHDGEELVLVADDEEVVAGEHVLQQRLTQPG